MQSRDESHQGGAIVTKAVLNFMHFSNSLMAFYSDHFCFFFESHELMMFSFCCDSDPVVTPSWFHWLRSSILLQLKKNSSLNSEQEDKCYPSCCSFFPTCQVRVVRFYVCCPSFLLPASFFLLLLPSFFADILAVLFARCRQMSTWTSRVQWAVPDLNSELKSAVGSAGPQ